ncbi:MAG: hypothetical protein Q7U54_10835 [Bacteroidales bacterium]|nr:hypothetical protein [Bacteroidales bacterium]
MPRLIEITNKIIYVYYSGCYNVNKTTFTIRIEQSAYAANRPFWDTSDPKSEQLLNVLRKPALRDIVYSGCRGVIIDQSLFRNRQFQFSNK